MATAIEFNNISKQYRLGLVSTKTLSHDLNRWWKTSVLGKEDPYLKIGSVNDRSKAADSEYVWALKNIDFKVEQGDVVGIIGKNGAGKSTLLKLLSKVTGPTTGTIRAKGRIASLLEVGTGFHSELTGRENIYMNGAILGMSKYEIRKKIDEIIDFSGCERYIDTPVKRYSSGMTVRLGFAVAAHLDPDILVVDEVLAVGDAEFQKKAIGKMQDVSRGEGRTVLFVSHNMTSIRSLCRTGVLLENGQVKLIGTVNDVVNEYLSLNADEVAINSDLSLREDRYGNGELLVTKILIKNKDGKEIEETFVGQYVRIELSFVNKGSNLDDLIFSCGFEDRYGNRANEWVTDEMELPKKTLEEGKIILEIPNLNLRPNQYYLFFKCMMRDTDEKNIADSLHFAKQLHVMSFPYYSEGKNLREGRGYEAIINAQFK